VSQYKFVLCSYRVKKQTPKEVMVVEGYTADFSDKIRKCNYSFVFIILCNEKESILKADFH